MTVLKWLGGPGSITFLALCCAIGLLLRWRGRIQLGRTWLLTVYVFYLIAGVPWVANAIASRLDPAPPPPLASLDSGVDAIVVLHGDNVLARIREGHRLWSQKPSLPVLALGDPDFCERLLDTGIAPAATECDGAARTTRAQIADVVTRMKRGAFRKPAVIASRLQMPRVAALLKSSAGDVILAPSPIDDEPPVSGLSQFVPQYVALRVTRDATYEHVAIWYYRRQGWLSKSR